MNVLIVKTSSMGDVLHTLPALTDAMQAIPGIRFDWVVEENFAQIPGWHPAVNRVIPVAIRRWRKQWFGKQQRKERASFRKTLKQVQYDAVIDAQGLIKSAMLVTRLARGIKHGQDSHSAREPFASWWYDRRHTISKQQHAVDRTRELFAKSLGYCQPATPGNYAIAPHFFRQLSADADRYLIFLHATTRNDKHWPVKQWRALIEQLRPEGLRIKLPWGTLHEQERAKHIAAGFDFVEVLPRMTLEAIATILAGATVIISVDTGLSHLAAALDKPNITLYGPTDPALIGGYGKNQLACCAPGHDLNQLIAPTVYTRFKQVMEKLHQN